MRFAGLGTRMSASDGKIHSKSPHMFIFRAMKHQSQEPVSSMARTYLGNNSLVPMDRLRRRRYYDDDPTLLAGWVATCLSDPLEGK